MNTLPGTSLKMNWIYLFGLMSFALAVSIRLYIPALAAACAAVYSIIETAKGNGLNVRVYLEYLLLYMPDVHWQGDPESLENLMPWSNQVQAHAFSDIFGKTSKEHLLQLNAPSDYDDVSSEQLEELLSQVTLKSYAAKKLKTVSSLAKTSFGVTFCVDSFSFQLKLLIEQINFIEKQVADVEAQMSQLLEKIQTPITTIPGIGNVIGATILGEIGDINRFSSGAKLVAYAGIDASVSQSGEYESTNNHMSKRGSPYLRKALFRAAFVASNTDPTFKAYYQKKRMEGKHHNVAVGAVARKLCYTIYAVLKNNVSYKVQAPRE